jgi:hypothetical protein
MPIPQVKLISRSGVWQWRERAAFLRSAFFNALELCAYRVYLADRKAK